MMHLGTGLVCGLKILDLLQAGFRFTIFLADWHAWINNKLGGVMENIRLCGEYFKEAFAALGLTPDRVDYVWASDLAGDAGYWAKVIRVAKSATVSRVVRCLPIMGRDLSAREVDAASLFYPCMQVADIFHLEIDCACAGLDQRKAHMLARDVADKLNAKKPVALHTPLLLGLGGPGEKMGSGPFDEDEHYSRQIASKMSKSTPKSCIYIHDSAEEIRRKIQGAFCPPKAAENNPILEIARYVVFAARESLPVERPQRFGGPITFYSYRELEDAYVTGALHPTDLKGGVAEVLIDILAPVRAHFQGKEALIRRIGAAEAGGLGASVGR